MIKIIGNRPGLEDILRLTKQCKKKDPLPLVLDYIQEIDYVKNNLNIDPITYEAVALIRLRKRYIQEYLTNNSITIKKQPLLFLTHQSQHL